MPGTGTPPLFDARTYRHFGCADEATLGALVFQEQITQNVDPETGALNAHLGNSTFG